MAGPCPGSVKTQEKLVFRRVGLSSSSTKRPPQLGHLPLCSRLEQRRKAERTATQVACLSQPHHHALTWLLPSHSWPGRCSMKNPLLDQ